MADKKVLKLSEAERNQLALGLLMKEQGTFIKEISPLILQVKPLKLRQKFLKSRGDLAVSMKDLAKKFGIEREENDGPMQDA